MLHCMLQVKVRTKSIIRGLFERLELIMETTVWLSQKNKIRFWAHIDAHMYEATTIG